MGNKNNNGSNAKPFLKWAGGKKQVIKFIEEKELWPNEIKESEAINNYVEPFLGGGAVFFHLTSKYPIKNAYLGDINKDLILTYKVVKDKCDDLIYILDSWENDFKNLNTDKRRKIYEHTRESFNDNLEGFDHRATLSDDHVIRAAQMIFLNRTCYN